MPMSHRDRRALIIFGAVTVVAVAVFFLFIAKSPKTTSAGSRRGSQLNVTQPTPTPSPTKAKKNHKEVLVFSGRDPFDPAQGGGSVSAPAGAPTVAPPGSASSPTGGSSKQVGGKTVVLVDIFSEDGVEKAQVEVDGTVYTVAEGDTFDDGYRLVSINGTCASFTHSASSFTLCESANK
ncbi:MAG TPA: hypothetical protein VGL18_13910 [Actinomycetota bacterium]